MKNLHDVIRRPLVTEKSTTANEDQNKAVFEVDVRATKPEIRRAVEELLGVRVRKVNTCHYAGKKKRVRQKVGRQRNWKKAIVTLEPGQRLEYFEGV